MFGSCGVQANYNARRLTASARLEKCSVFSVRFVWRPQGTAFVSYPSMAHELNTEH
jgi:hypothetical protein